VGQKKWVKISFLFMKFRDVLKFIIYCQVIKNISKDVK